MHSMVSSSGYDSHDVNGCQRTDKTKMWEINFDVDWGFIWERIVVCVYGAYVFLRPCFGYDM